MSPLSLEFIIEVKWNLIASLPFYFDLKNSKSNITQRSATPAINPRRAILSSKILSYIISIWLDRILLY